ANFKLAICILEFANRLPLTPIPSPRSGGEGSKRRSPRRRRGRSLAGRKVFLRGSRVSAMGGDVAHGGLAHEDFGMEPLAPGERRNISVFVHRDIVFRRVTRMELLAQGSAGVRMSAMIQQQLRERRRLRPLLV